MAEYLTRAEFARQKSRLTRAINSGSPMNVLKAVEDTVEEWHGKAWPDDWARWARALDDAYHKFCRSPEYDDDQDINDGRIARRFRAAFDSIHA